MQRVEPPQLRVRRGWYARRMTTVPLLVRPAFQQRLGERLAPAAPAPPAIDQPPGVLSDTERSVLEHYMQSGTGGFSSPEWHVLNGLLTRMQLPERTPMLGLVPGLLWADAQARTLRVEPVVVTPALVTPDLTPLHTACDENYDARHEYRAELQDQVQSQTIPENTCPQIDAIQKVLTSALRDASDARCKNTSEESLREAIDDIERALDGIDLEPIRDANHALRELGKTWYQLARSGETVLQAVVEREGRAIQALTASLASTEPVAPAAPTAAITPGLVRDESRSAPCAALAVPSPRAITR